METTGVSAGSDSYYGDGSSAVTSIEPRPISSFFPSGDLLLKTLNTNASSASKSMLPSVIVTLIVFGTITVHCVPSRGPELSTQEATVLASDSPSLCAAIIRLARIASAQLKIGQGHGGEISIRLMPHVDNPGARPNNQPEYSVAAPTIHSPIWQDGGAAMVYDHQTVPAPRGAPPVADKSEYFPAVVPGQGAIRPRSAPRPRVDLFEAILLMDVIEHFEHDAGQGIIAQAIAILENYQQADGSVVIPEVLRGWVGKDRIVAR